MRLPVFHMPAGGLLLLASCLPYEGLTVPLLSRDHPTAGKDVGWWKPPQLAQEGPLGLAQLKITASLPGGANSKQQRGDHPVLLWTFPRGAVLRMLCWGDTWEKQRLEQGVAEKADFHWVGMIPWWKGFDMSEFIFLGEMIMNIQRKEFGLSWRVLSNT